MDFFTSDFHFGHANIIRYSNRPYKNVNEMNEAIISNINALVKSDDVLWFLGDFCFGPKDPNEFVKCAERYRNKINCDNIILIWGNHDPDPFSHLEEERKKADAFRNLFIEDYSVRNTKIMGQKITLCHYAMKTWHVSHRGAYHLYGHSHGSLRDDPNSLSFDCGVDCHNYKPLSFKDVVAIMAKKTFKPIDHHGKNNERTE